MVQFYTGGQWLEFRRLETSGPSDFELRRRPGILDVWHCYSLLPIGGNVHVYTGSSALRGPPPSYSYVMVSGSHSSGLEYPLLNAYVTRGRLLFVLGRRTVHTAPSEVRTRTRAMRFDEGIQCYSITPVSDKVSFAYVCLSIFLFVYVLFHVSSSCRRRGIHGEHLLSWDVYCMLKRQLQYL